MESATAHPLQAVADAITLNEFKTPHKPKVVLTWAPHPKNTPSCGWEFFYKDDGKTRCQFYNCSPGYALNPLITKGVKCINNQEEALENADFIYSKELFI